MTIVVAGGTGFLGSALVNELRTEGSRVLVLTRRPRREDDIRWSTDESDTNWTTALSGATAVVNLAGEGIADKRWTERRKAAIIDSRIRATRAIVMAMSRVERPPRTLISSSAIGIYGADRGDEPVTEESSIGSDFLARTCRDWEAEAQPASAIARLVLLRAGVVLAKQGGALPQMALPFRFFAGGRVGSGRQYTSWIHLADWTSMVRWALVNDSVSGPLNLTAPAPVTNSEFSRALGRAMRRPSLMPAPAFALRLALGEMADALLLGGQRVLPAKAQRLGFAFRFSTIDAALEEIYRQADGTGGP
jgi:uncharacterized protein (TIGR01777 family)